MTRCASCGSERGEGKRACESCGTLFQPSLAGFQTGASVEPPERIVMAFSDARESNAIGRKCSLSFTDFRVVSIRRGRLGFVMEMLLEHLIGSVTAGVVDVLDERRKNAQWRDLSLDEVIGKDVHNISLRYESIESIEPSHRVSGSQVKLVFGKKDKVFFLAGKRPEALKAGLSAISLLSGKVRIP